MRRLIVSALVSLDGVQGEPRSWASAWFDEDATAKALSQLLAADAMLMGRRTYEYFAPAWPQTPGPYAERVNTMQKYVFSTKLATAEWSRTTIVSEDVVTAVRALKEQGEGDLVSYGFGRLGHTLLEHDLVDELGLAVHPVVLGGGEPVLRPGKPIGLELADVERRPNGVVSLTYRRGTDPSGGSARSRPA